MSNQIAVIEKELVKIEKALVNKALIIQDMNQLLGFYFTYLSHYIPILEYAVECLPENSIAKLANFGMLIDHLCSIKIDSVLALQADLNARSISEKTKKPKTEIVKILNEITLAQKVQIGSSLVMSSSLTRDLTLCAASSKFNAINKIIVWSNIFSHFSKFPVLIEQFIDEELIEEAEKDLYKDKYSAQKSIEDKSRRYDYDLAGEWFECVGLTRQVIQELPKYFIGPKLAWLEAMEGLELAKCILRKDKKFGERALLFNRRIINILKNKNFTTDEWAYRNFNTSGPNCDVERLVSFAAGEEGAYLTPVNNHTIFVQSKTHQFFIIIPSWFGFYINPSMQFQVSEELSIPISHDIGAIISFYNNPAKFVIDILKMLSKPEDSIYLLAKQRDRKNIERIVEDFDSLVTKLAITYNDKIDLSILSVVNQTAKTGLEGILVYGILFSLEKVAQSAGISITAPLWSQTRLAITGILISKIRLFSSKATELAKDEDKKVREKAKIENIAVTTEDRIRLLYEKIEESQKYMTEALEELEEAGLINLMGLTNEIKDILLSGLSPEEINQKLEEYYESIKE